MPRADWQDGVLRNLWAVLADPAAHNLPGALTNREKMMSNQAYWILAIVAAVVVYNVVMYQLWKRNIRRIAELDVQLQEIEKAPVAFTAGAQSFR